MARPITKSQSFIYDIQGLEYTTPVCPELSEIRGYNLPVKDQVWFRDLSYEQWDWNTDPSKGKIWIDVASPEQKKWFNDEIERLHKGTWIMICGIPTYFNNYCYFFHQWFMLLQQKYPDYKDTSLEYFRFFELCEKDKFTFGDIGIKGRRVGLSSMSASNKCLVGILESNTMSGIVSKTGIDAQEMFFMVKNGIDNLPPFLMPELNKVTEGEIYIAKPSKKTKANPDKGKNNRINWLDTSESAYDGRGMRHITLDEAGKWLKFNVKKCLSAISDTLVQGARIVGKISIFSTVNAGDKGGNNFKEIWDDSDHIKGPLDKYGRTKTKLKRFFIPAYRGYLGYVGKYGESIIENPTKQQIEFLKTHEYWDPVTKQMETCPDPLVGAKQWLEETRKMLENDPEALADEMRKNPFTWKEVFKGANNRCNFDLESLNEQIAKIDVEIKALGQKENGRRCKVRMGDNGEKYFEDNVQGMWYILELISDNNKVAYQGSIKCPDNTIFGAAGLDPFAHSKSPVDPGSDACCIVHKRYDSLNPETSNMPIAMFLGRPKTKEEFFEQIYWGLEYYGIKLLGERAPTDWLDHAMKKTVRLASEEDDIKKHGYLMTTKRANGSEIYGIAPQDKEAREQHLTEMVEYAQNNMHKIKFIRLLNDMLKFDIDERTDYDACMAWGYALIGLKEWKSIHKIAIKVKTFMKFKKSKVYH